ncbi:MAG: hypothetical protein A2675_01170 [Candidatus Yonathbacteria bacterium RIFCSPHIGHO2_01_FULL_51_10]|uniref:Type II secretion system protein GspG C-terminal domain-containing protein n=1 Tax=Candidatus Yonathbacteria bacterium RIFCSPHIGHO2_01_FULL_51_10 TaxID=1802723 RepID=A0A1G2S5Z1_9BACT|nr:MAG: hypothetical protein A2675_01170 [Candidatus Yonathbacteria bacterium RIFCSPHIGHO2_01_FULL_51_10]
MHRTLRRPNGFTLIELLVVISIISLLSSVVLASLSQARAKARDVVRIRDLGEIQKALELSFDKYGYYPIKNGTSVQAALSTTGNTNWTTLGNGLKTDGFMAKLSVDPTNNGGIMTSSTGYAYRYQVSADGKSYDLIARFETENSLRCEILHQNAYVTAGPSGTPYTTAGSVLCPNSNDSVDQYNHLYLIGNKN